MASPQALISPPSTCPVCLKGLEKCDLGKPEHCHHFFCFSCILEWSKNVNTCPLDRVEFNHIMLYRQFGRKFVKSIYVPDHSLDDVLIDPEELTYCEVCHECNREESLLLCDGCDKGYHLDCLTPPLSQVPEGNWYCQQCERIVYGADHEDSQAESSSESVLQIVIGSSDTEEEEMTDEATVTSSSQGSKEEGMPDEVVASSSSQASKSELAAAASSSGFASDSSRSPTECRRWKVGHSLRTREMWHPVVVVSTSSDEVDVDTVNESVEENLQALHSGAQASSPGRPARRSLPDTCLPDSSGSLLQTARKSPRICHASANVSHSSTSNNISRRSHYLPSSTLVKRRKATRGKDVKKRCYKSWRKRRKKSSKQARPDRRKRRRLTTIAKNFSRARTVATHRITLPRVDQSIRQAVIASHRFARAEEGVRAAQKVVQEVRRSTTECWHSGSLASTPFSSLTQNVCIPSRAEKPHLTFPPCMTSGPVSSGSSRVQHKSLGDMAQGRSSSPPPPTPVNATSLKVKPKVLNIPQISKTERINRKRGSLPTPDTANSPLNGILCSMSSSSRNVKMEGISSSSSSPIVPTASASTVTRRNLPVQPSLSVKAKSTKNQAAQVARDCQVKQPKNSKSHPLKIEQPIVTDLLGAITKDLDDLQAKQCIFKRDGSIIPVHESPPLLPTRHPQFSNNTPENNSTTPCGPHASIVSKIKSPSTLETNGCHVEKVRGKQSVDLEDDPAVVNPYYISQYGSINDAWMESSASDLVRYTMPVGAVSGSSNFEQERESNDSTRCPSFMSRDDASSNGSLWSPPPNSFKRSYSTLEEIAISSLQHTTTNSNTSRYSDGSMPLSDSLANAVIAVANTALLMQRLAQERRISLSDHMDDGTSDSTARFNSQEAMPSMLDSLVGQSLFRESCCTHNVQSQSSLGHPTSEAAPKSLLGEYCSTGTSHLPFECPPSKAKPVRLFDQPCSPDDDHFFKSSSSKATPVPRFSKSCSAPVSDSLDTNYHGCASSFDHSPRHVPCPVSLFPCKSPQPREHSSLQTTLPTEPVPLFSSLPTRNNAVSVEPLLPSLIDNGTRNQSCAKPVTMAMIPLPDPTALACNQKQACDTVLKQLHFHLQSQRICHSDSIKIRERAFKKVMSTKHLVGTERVKKLVDDYVEMYRCCQRQ